MLKTEILSFMLDNTYFEANEEEEESILNYTTRRHGNMATEEPGQKDLAEQARVLKLLKEKFGTQIEAWGDYVDEWVDINIKIK